MNEPRTHPPREAEDLVSCVIPAFNAERYLAEAVESVLAQTYRPLEVIVADDGSSDATRHVAAAFGEAVRVVTQPTAGPPATRNLGLRTARGAFVAFLDADDRWRPEKLAQQMARFHARADLGVSVTHIQNFWDEEHQEEARRWADDPRAGPLPGYVTMTMLARRAAFDRVGEFDETLWHSDAGDWFLRADAAGIVVEMLPEVLTLHRMHERNLSRRMGDASRAEFVRLVKRSLDARRAGGDVAPLLRSFADR